MSAYQDLMTALATRRPDQSAAEDQRIVEAALAERAHELAEQIRQAWAAHDPRRPGNVTMLSALNAADLIDPRVTSGAGVTGARDELWDELGIDPDRISREEFEEYLDTYDRAASAGPVRPDEEPTT